MHLHLLSIDESYVNCIEKGPHVPMKVCTSIGADGEDMVKDSNLKFLRALPKEWKPMTVSLRNTQEFKDYTLERLYGTLKTYELEMEQDEKDKGKSQVEETEKLVNEENSESSKGKGKDIADSGEASDGIDEHLAFLSRRFSKLKFKKNFNPAKSFKSISKPDRSMVDRSKFKCFNCGNAAKDDLLVVLKREEIIRKQFEKEQEIIAKWKSGRDVSTNIINMQGRETFVVNELKRDKKALEISEDNSSDENTDDDHQLKTKASTDESHQLSKNSSVDKKTLKKLNKKYGPVKKNFVKGENNSSETSESVNNIHNSSNKTKKKLDASESKSEETKKKKGNRNGKIGVNKHTNYTPNASAPRKTFSKCGSVNHLSANCKTVIAPNLPLPIHMPSVPHMNLPAMNMMPGLLPHNSYSQAGMPYMFNPYFNAFNMPQFHSNLHGINNGNHKKNLWYLDSKCYRHMTAKENVIIDEVALVSGLKNNLLSISQLCDKGYKVNFTPAACVVTKGDDSNVVLIGQRKGNVYVADFNSVKSESITCFSAKQAQMTVGYGTKDCLI
ncbi:uncharacterized protein LOC135152181 [Daucus carota subsp. sativus]|uniref:uncharacterized protein LOC135152181 n=1 Tax=Daucus carota subsp. sativus TaxID=79200 RepID=UPI003083C6AC